MYILYIERERERQREIDTNVPILSPVANVIDHLGALRPLLSRVKVFWEFAVVDEEHTLQIPALDCLLDGLMEAWRPVKIYGNPGPPKKVEFGTIQTYVALSCSDNTCSLTRSFCPSFFLERLLQLSKTIGVGELQSLNKATCRTKLM